MSNSAMLGIYHVFNQYKTWLLTIACSESGLIKDLRRRHTRRCLKAHSGSTAVNAMAIRRQREWPVRSNGRQCDRIFYHFRWPALVPERIKFRLAVLTFLWVPWQLNASP